MKKRIDTEAKEIRQALKAGETLYESDLPTYLYAYMVEREIIWPANGCELILVG